MMIHRHHAYTKAAGLIVGFVCALATEMLFAQVTVTDVGRVALPYHLAYQPGRHKVVGDSFGTNQVVTPDTDLWQLDLSNPDTSGTPSSNVSGFSNLPRTRFGWWLNYPVAVQRNLPNGFQQDEIFAFRREWDNNAWRYHVARYSGDGSTANPTWATLTGLNDVVESGIALHIDHVGSWNHDLLYVTERRSDYKVASVFRIDSGGNVSYVADLPNPGHPDFRWPWLSVPRALTVIPNNPARYGSLAGHLLVAREGMSGTRDDNVNIPGSPLYTVNPVDNSVTVHGYVPIRIGGIQVITGTYLLISDWGANTVRMLHVPDLGNYIGQLIVVSTASEGTFGGLTITPNHTTGLYLLNYDPNTGLWSSQILVDFSVYGIYGKDLSVTFVPEPASVLVLCVGLAGLAARRKSRSRRQ